MTSSEIKASAVKVTIKQHNEGVASDSISMFDLSAEGLDAVDSGGMACPACIHVCTYAPRNVHSVVDG